MDEPGHEERGSTAMNLTGAQRVAAIIAQLDAERAQRILRQFSENESVRVLFELARLPTLTEDEVRAVVAEFSRELGAYIQVHQGGLEVAERFLKERLGPQRAAEVLVELKIATDDQPLAFLNTFEPAQIANFLAEEHPQTISLVLASIYPELAARVLEHMAQDKAADVVRRFASLAAVPMETLSEVASVLRNRMASMSAGFSSATSGGVPAAAAILNNVERGQDREILKLIEADDPELAEQIRDEMFVFDDIVHLDDAAIQQVVRSVTLRTLALALKTANKDLVEKIKKNSTERFLADLEEETQSLGAQLMSKVEAAQANVVRTVRGLIDEGTISVQRAGDELIA
jgi:flagellar motor switch protein FliG